MCDQKCECESVCEVDHPVQWCFRLNESCSMETFNNSPYKDYRRQDLQKNYRENGAIYIVKVAKLQEKAFNFYAPQCYAYVMDRDRSVDIDTEIDFRIAEVLITNG